MRRVFGEDGRPLEKVFVDYVSVASAASCFDTIRKSHRTFQVDSFQPQIEFYHPPERPRSPTHKESSSQAHVPLDSPRSDSNWMLSLDVMGLPQDFQSKFEIEGLIGHILGAAHPSLVLRSIDLSPDPNTPSTIAHLIFTEHIHLAELMNRTFGAVVLRGYHLTLVPRQPPESIVEEGEEMIGNAQQIAIPTLDVLYQVPIRVPPHPMAPVDHNYVFHRESGSILDLTSGLFFHPHLRCFIDLEGRTVPFDDPRVLCLLTPESNPPESSTTDALQPSSEQEKPADTSTVLRGPIEFVLKSTSQSGNKQKQSSLLQASTTTQSKLAIPTITTSEANPMQAPTRGGRLFVNIPHERPARASVPHSSTDLPFTRCGDICLLCRAKFASIARLQEHIKTSANHAHQLRMILDKFGLSPEDLDDGVTGEAQNTKKRPRSAQEKEDERGQEDELDDGLPALVVPPSPMNAQEEPTPTSNANIGMKLMQKIGYQGGKLGRNAK